MLTQDFYPFLPLDRWREIIGYNPWHFFGLIDAQKMPVTSACNTLLFQHTWQAYDRTGREDIIEAIARAEKRLFDFLNFWPYPRYTEKTFTFPQYPDRRVQKIGWAGGDGAWASLDLQERYVQKIGVETFALLGANQAVTYSDLDGDTLSETFTVTLAAPAGLTDVTEVRVYFNATDRYTGESIGARWEIKPIRASLTGGNLVIVGNSWNCVKPVKYETGRGVDLQISETTNFASSVDVYRRYIDPTGSTVDTAQGKVIWETLPYWNYAVCDPVNNSTDPAALAYATARAGIRDSRLGLVTPAQAVYNSTYQTWGSPDWPGSCRPPDRVTLRYEAGYPLDAGRVSLSMERTIAYLAAAELVKGICACEVANKNLYYWQFDLSKVGGDESYGVSPADLENPFGTRRGHVYAWKEVKHLRILTGFSPSIY